LQKVTAILLLAFIAFVSIDGFFNGWGTIRSIMTMNTLELRGKNNLSWKLLARRDFQLISVKSIQNVLIPDSLRNIDSVYRNAGYYRLYFRTSDSLSPKLQKMYQALLTVDTGQTIKRTITDAERAYLNIQKILHTGKSLFRDSSKRSSPDTSTKIVKNDLTLGSGDEAASVLKRIASNPEVLIGLGIGVAASTAIDLFKGGAYLAVAKNDVFRLDSLNVGTRTGTWEDAPIDILWAFAKQDTIARRNDNINQVSTLRNNR
jgi:hypothetical protein